MEDLKIMLNSIEGLDKAAMTAAKNYLDYLSKPIGSLGVLEDLVVKLSGIKGETIKKIDKKTIVVMCADNGIEREGVSSCPREVTAIVTQNIADGTTAVCKLCEYYNSDVELVDIGVDKNFDDPKIINKKINYGTRNMTKGPAMTREEAVKAIKIGI
ncbi:MAG: nicotinate-nucleotide--dimethylbenzimidazole phosphoribosyltransferase, partial [Clostridium sp.]